MQNYFPHRYCLLQNWHLITIDVLSDATIASSYLVISFALFYAVRNPLRFTRFMDFFVSVGSFRLLRLLISTAFFILACGCTHIINVWTMWQPTYTLDAVVRVIAAGLSVRTALTVIKLGSLFLAQERLRKRDSGE